MFMTALAAVVLATAAGSPDPAPTTQAADPPVTWSAPEMPSASTDAPASSTTATTASTTQTASTDQPPVQVTVVNGVVSSDQKLCSDSKVVPAPVPAAQLPPTKMYMQGTAPSPAIVIGRRSNGWVGGCGGGWVGGTTTVLNHVSGGVNTGPGHPCK